MAVTVGELVGYLKLDDSAWGRGQARARESMAATGRMGVSVFGFLGDYISGQAKSSGDSILTLTKYFAIFGGVASAAGIAAGAGIAALPLIFAGIAAGFLKDNQALKDSFTQLGDHIKSKMTDAAAPLVPVFQGVAKQLGATFDAILPQIKTIFGAIGPQITTLTGGLTSMVSNMMPGFVTAIKSAGPAVDGLASLLGNLGTGIGGLFANMSTGAAGAGQALSALGGGLAQILPTVGTLLGALAQVGGPILAALMPIISQLVSLLVGALVPVIQQLGPIFVSVLGGLQPLIAAFGRLFTAAGPIIVDLFTQLGHVLIQLAPVFALIVDAAAQLIGPLVSLLGPITPLITAFIKIIVVLVQGLTPILVKLIPIITEMATVFMTGLSNALITLMTALQPLIPVIGEVAIQIAQALLAALTALMPILPALIDALVQILPVLVALLPPIAQLVVALVPVIALLAQVVVWLVNLLAPALKLIIEVVVALAVIIISALTASIGWLLANVPPAWDAVVGAIGAAVNKIRGIVAWFGDMAAAIGGWFQRTYDSVVTWWNSAVLFVGSIPGRIMGALGDLGSLLVNAGMDIIRGLIRGLDNAIGWLKDKVASIGNMVKNAFSSVMGIFSPARAMIPLGQMIPAGLVVGIDAGIPALDRAVRDMAARSQIGMDTPDLARGALTQAGGAGQGGPPVHIDTFNAYADQTPDDIARELLWHAKAGG